MDLEDQNPTCGGQSPSVLSIMINKCEDIKDSVSLIKKEIGGPTDSSPAPIRSTKEYDSLINILKDTAVNSMIKSVAGEDTHRIVDKALKEADLGGNRKEILAQSLNRLKTNLGKAEKSSVRDDPTFNLALGLVGLSKRNLN